MQVEIGVYGAEAVDGDKGFGEGERRVGKGLGGDGGVDKGV